MEILAALAPLLVAAAVVGYALHANKKQRDAFAAALAHDPDVELLGGAQTGVSTRRPPFVKLVATGGGKNNPPRWDAIASCARLGARTSLHVSREGLSGSVRELFGVKDVHTGDTLFDEAFTLRGTEPDVVRAVLRDDAVRAALRALFDARAWSFEVAVDSGSVVARCARGRAGRVLDPDEAKGLALAVARLVEALEHNADAPPAREALATTASGGASGAPVGVPLGGRD